jgi:hypothetical protein
MTVNQVWLALVLVVSYIVQVVFSNRHYQYNKTICPSDSFHLEKCSHVLSVLFVVRN